MTTPAHVHTLQCTEQNCVLPVASITADSLVIVARHHGERHSARIPIVDVLRLISANVDIKSLTKAHNLVIPSAGSSPNRI